MFHDIQISWRNALAEPARKVDGEVVPGDDLTIEAVLARFNGDSRAALTAALDDIASLQRELSFANLTMSYGFARGWTPSIAKQSP